MNKKPGNENNQRLRTLLITAVGILVLAGLLAGGTILMSRSAHRDTSDAARSVSLLYLDEQVVEDNLKNSVSVINAAVTMITEEDLSDLEHMQAYQRRMKQLFSLEKFAFVDADGLIYTADDGILDEVDQYDFDHLALSGAEISIRNLPGSVKHVVIAVPIREEHLSIDGHELTVCFMEKDMDVMLSGVSMAAQNSGATFCNIYTRGGVALTNTVLGGLAVEDNLIEAMSHADYEDGYSYESFLDAFTRGEKGISAFSYNGTQETLAYVPVAGTD